MSEYHIADIILIDDDTDDRQLFKEALGLVSEKSVLTCYDSCAAAVARLKAEGPGCADVIFLDLMMPGIDGYECVRIIKQQNNLKDIPIVVLSSAVSPANMERLYDLGVSFFITKPPSFEKLKAVIDKMVNTPSMYTVRSKELFHVNREEYY